MEFSKEEEKYIRVMYEIWDSIKDCVESSYYEIRWFEVSSRIAEEGIPIEKIENYRRSKQWNKQYNSICDDIKRNMNYMIEHSGNGIQKGIMNKSKNCKRAVVVFNYLFQTVKEEYIAIRNLDGEKFYLKFTTICQKLGIWRIYVSKSKVILKCNLVSVGKAIEYMYKKEAKLGSSGSIFSSRIYQGYTSQDYNDEIDDTWLEFYKKIERNFFTFEKVKRLLEDLSEDAENLLLNNQEFEHKIREINQKNLIDKNEMDDREIIVIDELIKQLEGIKKVLYGNMTTIDYIDITKSIQKVKEEKAIIERIQEKLEKSY